MSSGLNFEKEQVELVLLRTKEVFPYWMWMSLYKWGVADSGKLAVKIRDLTVLFKQKKLYGLYDAQYSSIGRQALEFNVLTGGAVNRTILRAPSLIPKLVQEVLQADSPEALAMALKRLSVLWLTLSIWGFLDKGRYDFPDFIKSELQALMTSWVSIENAAAILMTLSAEHIAPESLSTGMKVFKALTLAERSIRLTRHTPDPTAGALDIYWKKLLSAHNKYVYSPKINVIDTLLDTHFPCKPAALVQVATASSERTPELPKVAAIAAGLAATAVRALETMHDTTWLRVETVVSKGMAGWTCMAVKVLPANSNKLSIQLATRFTDSAVYLESSKALLTAILANEAASLKEGENVARTTLFDISWIRVESEFVKVQEGWKCLNMAVFPANSHPATIELAKYFNKHSHVFKDDANILKAAVSPNELSASSLLKPVSNKLSMELSKLPQEAALRLLSSLLEETLNRK